MGRLLGTWLVLLGYCPLAFGQEPADSTPTPEGQFERLDRDGDGRLSKSEAGDRPFFERADADGDGTVTRDEAKAVVARAGRLRQRVGQVRGSRPESPLPKDVDRSADIRYSEAEGGKTELLTLDVYRSRGAKDVPVMIYVHGGGWTGGDKQAVGEKMPFFCQRGYVFVSVNYRLMPATKVPDQAQDVAAAVAWVHNHIREYGGNPDRLFLMGHSAGAHLVSIVATNETLLSNCGKDLSVIKGVIELDTAALDVVRTVASGQGMHAKVFGTDAATLKIISPYEHVTAGKSIPPFLLVVADNNTGKLEQSNAMAKKLREVGVHAEVIEAPDKTHGTLNQDLGKAGDKVTEKILGFLGVISSQLPAK